MKKTTILITIILTSGLLLAQNVPNINLKNLNGKSINIQKISKSKNIKVLAFWATWCVPCINELDAISEVYEDWQDETNVELIAISTDDSRTKKRIRPLVNGKDWEYEILLDDNQDLKRALNISVLPHLLVVKNGKIVYRKTSYTPGSEDELYEIIQKYAN
ncbi:MAG: TlpA disulfide reductase family protein [Flavobacteriaceae bacterium]|nr:TlpA disulfide reductase family protein [Flavobacteriaceae bacterium]|tara:strand:- start:637 stop:1119 length:483 start_codon:yes stop_codon:yes gene_type:complete